MPAKYDAVSGRISRRERGLWCRSGRATARRHEKNQGPQGCRYGHRQPQYRDLAAFDAGMCLLSPNEFAAGGERLSDRNVFINVGGRPARAGMKQSTV
jgi:hypothetical protein